MKRSICTNQTTANIWGTILPVVLPDVLSRGEGVDPLAFTTLRRELFCGRIDNLFTTNTAVVFRSPPKSGKSSLASLFAAWVASTRKNLSVYLVAGLSNKPAVVCFH